MKSARKRKLLAAAIVIVLLLLLVQVPFSGYRSRTETALSNALGRPVSVGDISVRLLPRPGFALSNVVISEDASFGNEPMLFAPEVTANLRLLGLLRGRLEFSSLSLKEASFNLVRRGDGKWNVESLMERAGRSAAVPTTEKRSVLRARFPYIEATSSRINLKVGNEKKHFALLDADFGLWMESQNEWRARFRASPFRTDANLTDVGTVRAEGRFLRSAGGAPQVRVQAQLENAQLGELSSLITDHDRGWRGAVNVNLEMSGPLDSLAVKTSAAIRGFHRYDIIPPDSLNLRAVCAARFQPMGAKVDQIDCHAASGEGTILIRGDVQNVFAHPAWHLQADVEAIPVSRVVAVARNAKKDLPADLTAEGAISVQAQLNSDPVTGARLWSGTGSTRELTLRSSESKSRLDLGVIEFTFGDSPAADVVPQRKRPPAESLPAPGFQIVVQPFHLPIGGSSNATAQGVLNAQGYRVELDGPARLQRLLATARLLGMRPPAYPIEGSAELQLQIAGDWAGFAPPLTTGNAWLTDVSTNALGVSAPLRIASARLTLNASEVRADNISASLGASGPRFGGTVWLPRNCAHPQDCTVRFSLRSPAIDLVALSKALQPFTPPRAWYDFSSAAAPVPTVFRRLRAQGQFVAAEVSLRDLRATEASAVLVLDSGKLTFSNLQARLYGGMHHGEWAADFTGAAPQYSGSGTMERVLIAPLAVLTGDPWGNGTVSGKYQAHLTGRTTGELLASATTEADFTWRDGSLNHFLLSPKAPPFRFAVFQAHLSLAAGRLAFSQGRIVAVGGIYQLSGTATFDRNLEFILTQGKSRQLSVSGTLDSPQVSLRQQAASSSAARAVGLSQ
jgi:hypothetical protein